MSIKAKLMQTLDDMESIVRLFNIRPFDIYLLGGAACLLGGYTDRAKKIDKYTAFSAYILSPEDIVVSKIIRLEQKDFQDIDKLITQCDKAIITTIINGVLNRTDLYESKKHLFINNLQRFKRQYNI